MSTNQNRGSLNDKFAGFGAEPSEGLFDSIYHTSDSSAGSLSTKFEGFGAEPSADLWDSVTAQLDGKRKRRVIIWWWSGGIAAVFLVVFGLNGAGVFDSAEQQYSEREFRLYSGQPEEFSEGEDRQNESELTTTNDINDWEISDNITQHSDGTTDSDVADERSNSFEDETPESNVAENGTINEAEDENTHLPDENTLTALSPIKNLPLMNTSKIPVDPLIPPVEFEEVRNKKSWWEVGVEYDYWVHVPDPFSVKKEDGFSSYTAPPPTTTDLESEELFNPIANNNVYGLESNAYYSQPATYGRVTKPLNLNFVLRYNFNKRFSLHSGLNYSRHFYRTTYSLGEIQYTVSTVNSVGLPIGLKWNFLHRPNFDLYTDAQQLFEIPFSERREEVYQAYAAEKNALQRNFTSGLLLSAQTGLGMRFGLTEKMSLNTAVNLRYYYFQRANGTAPLHKENMWLGGRVGLSWRL